MLLRPRYDGPTILSMSGAPDDVLVPLIRQRRRLETLLASLTDEQWHAPSRCTAWTVRDVVAHLVSINPLYQLSAACGLAGEPTRLMGEFDPASTPPMMVDSMGPQPPQEVLEHFVATNNDFFNAVRGLDEVSWSVLAESPVGHVPIRFVCAHALWDSWVHERDITVPLGLPFTVEPDEVAVSLRYIAALGPAFGMGAAGRRYEGAFAVEATDPQVSFVVEVDSAVHVRDGSATADMPVLRGSAVELVEALTSRLPLPTSAPAEWRRLHNGLRETWNLTLVT
jgi:uncharacterized protein (TIGR03083 family)